MMMLLVGDEEDRGGCCKVLFGSRAEKQIMQ